MLLLLLLICATSISTVASSAVTPAIPSDRTVSSSILANIDAHMDDHMDDSDDFSTDHQIHLEEPILRKRDTPTTDDDTEYEDGWKILTQDFSILLPLSAASATLESFYQKVIDQATSYSGSQPASRYFTLAQDDLTLSFYSANTGIPWTLVSAFASQMLDKVRQGFTGTFQTIYCIAPTESSSKLR